MPLSGDPEPLGTFPVPSLSSIRAFETARGADHPFPGRKASPMLNASGASPHSPKGRETLTICSGTGERRERIPARLGGAGLDGARARARGSSPASHAHHTLHHPVGLCLRPGLACDAGQAGTEPAFRAGDPRMGGEGGDPQATQGHGLHLHGGKLGRSCVAESVSMGASAPGERDGGSHDLRSDPAFGRSVMSVASQGAGQCFRAEDPGRRLGQRLRARQSP